MQMSWDESIFAWNDADETVFPYLRIVQSGSRSFNDFDGAYDDATKANIL